jgi:hypothetical protein
MEACGPAKYEEALRQVYAMVPIWRKNVAAHNLRKEEKTAARERTRVRATERATERAAVLESERAATIAGLAGWDAKYAAANPVELSTPSSHMVSRALLQTVLKKLNELEPRMRLGGHNMGRATKELDDVMKAIEATTVEHVEKCKPDWSTEVGGGKPPSAPLATTFLINTTQLCLSTIGHQNAS